MTIPKAPPLPKQIQGEPKVQAFVLARDPDGWVIHELHLPADSLKYTAKSAGPHPSDVIMSKLLEILIRKTTGLT